MAIEVNGTALSFKTQIYSDDTPELLKVRTQKISVHHTVWDITAVQVLEVTNGRRRRQMTALLW